MLAYVPQEHLFCVTVTQRSHCRLPQAVGSELEKSKATRRKIVRHSARLWAAVWIVTVLVFTLCGPGAVAAGKAMRRL
jgi:hypothetical protein